jgi:hypothetical protein
VNGTSVGTNSIAFTYVPVNNDVVTCTLVSNASCVVQNTVISNQISMTVNSVPSPPVITVHENTLFSSSPVGNSWYYSGNMIPGANGSSYVATQNGFYWAIVTINDCSSDTSNNINLTISEIDNVDNTFSAVLYPNPNDGHFNVKINGQNLGKIDITIFNILGIKIFENQNIPIRGPFLMVMENIQNKGLYWIEIKSTGFRLLRLPLIVQ